MRRKHRIVLDTNVLVSAILFGGPPRQVLGLAISGEVEAFLSPAILDELRAVLQRPKFGLTAEQSALIEEELRSTVRVIVPEIRVVIVAADPKDDMVLECAMGARADLIVSGDRHLLDLGGYQGVPVLTPAQFLAMIGRTGGAG